MQNLLYLDLIFKLASGLLLIAAPLLVCKIFGLPNPTTGFWPRLLGGVLIGHAGGLFLELAVPKANGFGIGLGGALIVNLATAGMIATLLIFKAAGSTRRARFTLWLLTIALVLLSGAQLAHTS
ncbi:MAG: ABC transporter permease [Hyphomicrobiaceae bacterium]